MSTNDSTNQIPHLGVPIRSAMLVVGVALILMSNSSWVDGEWKLTFSKPLTSELSEGDHRQYGPSVEIWRTFGGLSFVTHFCTYFWGIFYPPASPTPIRFSSAVGVLFTDEPNPYSVG